MRLTIATVDDQVVNIDVEDSETVQTLKIIIEAETGIPAAAQLLTASDLLTTDSSTLTECKLADGDVLSLTRIEAPSGVPSGGKPIADQQVAAPPTDPARFLEWIQGTPMLMTQLRQGANPPLMDAINSGNAKLALDIFTENQRRQRDQQKDEEQQRQEEADLWNADPMDIEAQTKIAERINQQQIAHNFEQAWEHNPEIFAQVDMLYVEFELNRHAVAAFVDSGAQITIVGLQTAQTLGIAHLIDKRFAGIAKGVGSGKIVGRIHQAPMRVGGEYLATSLTVMENDEMPFLFGLDMMRRHQVQIDLKDNALRFTHLGVSLPFLPPHQIPVGMVGRPRLTEPDQPSPHATEAGQAAGCASNAARLAGAAAARRASGGSASQPATAAPSGADAAAGSSGGSSSSTERLRQEALLKQAAVLVSGLASTKLPAAEATGPSQQARAPAAALSPPQLTSIGGHGRGDGKVQQLMALGFTENQSMEALAVCSGNVEQAAGFLYSV